MGTRRGGDFQSLREILERSPAMRLLRDHDRMAELRETWRKTVERVDDGIATNTRITRYKGGRLVVEVYSAALLLELSTFRRQKLLDALRETDAFRGIADITFKAAG